MKRGITILVSTMALVGLGLVSAAAGLGDACSADLDCLPANSECVGTSSVCSCKTGFLASSSGSSCESEYIPANKSTIFNPKSFAELQRQVECNFDTNTLCNWYSSRYTAQLFVLNQHDTPSSDTGPDSDHTKGAGSDGYYAYLETSAPVKENEMAVLVSPDLLPSNNDSVCFSFWYSMNGATVGTLEVKQVHTNYVTLFSKTGDQGTDWHQANVTVKPPGPVCIVVEATVGNGYKGDIAVDDFTLTDGEC